MLIGTNSRVDWIKVKEKQTHKFCIVIPAYKEHIDIDEELSLDKLHKTLSYKENVYLVCPPGMNTGKYKAIFPELQIMEFEPENFISIDAYSHLCMQYEFYNAFSKYEYMYIYQLDCFLLDDNLAYWCDKEYDYIGAPILVPVNDWKNFKQLPNGEIECWAVVGNGGFSLRKISTFKELTNPNGELRKRYKMTDETLKDIKVEDVYFCTKLSKLYDIEIPNYAEALEFAIDMNPDIAFSKYGAKKLPMCIHAFGKNIPFWKEKIKEFDNEDLYNVCYEKHKEFMNIYYHKNAQ